MDTTFKLQIAGLLLSLCCFQYQSKAQDTLYVDAGGFDLRMVKKGNGTGPTIIMGQGLGMQLE
ncbi:MAG TPA: hypothetical protein PKC24_15995, partial [Cyclobacteriaceae bacterium]|nr:hypothetical protein [Cyclobacteriaceae bacterium]